MEITPQKDLLRLHLSGDWKLGSDIPIFSELNLGSPINQEQFSIQQFNGGLEMLVFAGDCVISFVGLITGKTKLRWRDFFVIVQECEGN